MLSLILSAIFVLACNLSNSQVIDLNGYILYCPCMGRFGNQAEQLLGSLQFAKALGRTLILPPFIEYEKMHINLIPFGSLLNISHLQIFHKVVSIDVFMQDISGTIWKPEERSIFCYSKRPGKSENDCNPCEGNPFETFWKQLNITSFASSVFYAPLQTNHRQAADWITQYSKHKVLTFVGAPSSFPVDSDAVNIQKFIRLSSDLENEAIIHKGNLGLNKPYVGVHLRWGMDWKRACSLLEENGMKRIFSSSQCSSGKHDIPFELCLQDVQLVIRSIHRILLENRNISTVFIATDLDDHNSWQLIYDDLKTDISDLRLVTPTSIFGSSVAGDVLESRSFQIDLYLLATSDIFIGNCISSFSAFVTRLRSLSLNKPRETTQFLGIEYLNKYSRHDEL